MNSVLIKDFLKINKKQIISFTIISCLILSLLLIIQIYSQISKKLIPSLQERNENKILHISNIQKEKKIYSFVDKKKIRSISYYISNGVYNNELGNLMLSTKIPTESIDIQEGRNVYNNENEIIISEALYRNLKNISINSEIILSIKNEKINCKIVGYYKNDDSIPFNKVYISNHIVNKIKHNVLEYIVEVKNTKDVDYIIEKMLSKNIDVELFDDRYQSELKIYRDVLSIIKPFVFIVIILLIINIYILMNNIVNEKILSIIILKLSGYKSLVISFNVFIAIFLLTTLICFCLNIILFVGFAVMNFIFNSNLVYFYSDSISIFTIMNILLLVITLFLIYKIKNKKILSVLYKN